MTLSTPQVVQRGEQPYVAIPALVAMHELGAQLPPLTPRLFGWLAARGVAPAGPPFWKYNVIDMAALLEVEVGVGVERPVAGDDQVRSGVLPAGRYVVARHRGHPDTLEPATAELLAWSETQGLRWDVRQVDGQERWVARLEEYLTDPDDEPDLTQWETDLVFRLAQ